MLFWSPDQQAIGFKSFDKLYASRTVECGSPVWALPVDPPIDIHYRYQGADGDTDSFMRDNRVFGLLVLKSGRIKLEKYAKGLTASDRWTSFSIAKSITSTLVGTALKDGKKMSRDQPVADYVPSLRGTGYDGVTIRQTLNMSTGVRWDEDYANPNSDTNKVIAIIAARQSGGMLRHIAKAPRAWPPDSQFEYNSGASDVLGHVVSAATGTHLADYLSDKVWKPAGMEADALWTTDGPDGHEFGGGFVSARLRDFGRFGLFALNNFTGVDGISRVPDGWLNMVRGGSPASKGYGYQWWLFSPDAFTAVGVFGQFISISPNKDLVIVMLSAYPTPLEQAFMDRAGSYAEAVAALSD